MAPPPAVPGDRRREDRELRLEPGSGRVLRKPRRDRMAHRAADGRGAALGWIPRRSPCGASRGSLHQGCRALRGDRADREDRTRPPAGILSLVTRRFVPMLRVFRIAPLVALCLATASCTMSKT